MLRRRRWRAGLAALTSSLLLAAQLRNLRAWAPRLCLTGGLCLGRPASQAAHLGASAPGLPAFLLAWWSLL